MKAKIVIRRARELSKLGLYTYPSPYIIVKVGDNQDATGICNNTCHPEWNYETELEANMSLDKVTFYVYNNNPNYLDELLGVGTIEFEAFLTPALTKSRILLTDANGNYLKSYVQIQHQDQNPPPVNAALLNPMTTIRISLLGITATLERSIEWLRTFKKPSVHLQYGEQAKQLCANIPIITFRYDAKQTQISIKLQLAPKIVLCGQFSMQNIRQNTSMRVRLYYGNHQVIVLLSASMIANGYLPEKHNTFIVELSSILIQPIKKVPKNWTLVLHSVFGRETIKKLNEPYRLYIENNTNLQLEYFEEVDDRDLQIMEPIASHSIPVNSINWSNAFNAQENIKMYNPVRGIVINVDITCTLLKTQKQSGLVPELLQPNFLDWQDRATYQVYQIKMSNASFDQIFPQKTMFHLIYFSNQGSRTIFPTFELRKSSEYNIICRHNIQQYGKGGSMCLVTFDHFFGKQKDNQNDLQNFTIFKMPCKNIKQLTASQAAFNDKFLAFAKKKSLASPCKKFDSMVKDKILRVTLSFKNYPIFEPGLLKVQNCIVKGGVSRVEVFMIFDSNELRLEGESQCYMMNKNYSVKLKDNGIQLKIVDEGVTSQAYCQFQKVFGLPEPSKRYTVTIPMPQKMQLTIIYSYEIIKAPQFLKPIPPKQVHRFKPDTPIHIRIKSAIVKQENYRSFVLRVTKASTIYETLEQNPGNDFIRFRDIEKMFFQKQSKNDYMFFNLYCKNAENALVIYAGHYPVKSIIGRGMYQLLLTQLGQKQNKNMAILVFEVLNNVPLPHAAIKLSLSSIKLSNEEFLKSILKYYIVCQVNQAPIGIFELVKTNDGFRVKQSSIIKNAQNVVWRLYSSLKSINAQTFWSSDIQLIGSGKLMWTKIQNAGVFCLRFLPPRDLSTKLNSNSLALLQNSVKIILQYKIQPQQFQQIRLNNKLAKPIQIDILHSGAAIINILQILPYCSFEKTLQLQILPFSFECCAQSRLTLNKIYVTQLNNMRMTISVNRSVKSKQKYSKQYSQKQVNFRGKQLKTTEKMGFIVDFPGICLIKADAILLNSKFTNNTNGSLNLRSLSYSLSTISYVQVYPLSSWTDIRNELDKITPINIDFNGKTKLDLNKMLSINGITSGLYFIVTFSDNTKAKCLVQIARIHIDKLDDKPFTHQWVIENGKNMSVMQIQAEYKPNKVEELQLKTVQYNVQVDGNNTLVPIEYRTKQKIGIINQVQKEQVFRPDRKRGYRVIANIPDKLSVKSVSVVLGDDTKLTLKKAEHNSKVYTYNSDKQLKVKFVSIQSDQIEKIQQLQQKNFTRRFLINRDPTTIVYLLEEPYAIADCQPQTMVVNFRLHRIYSNQTMKKILWMRNNKNDEILTKNLFLFVKHGEQTKIIRPIDQNGEFDVESDKQLQKPTASFGFQPLSDQLQLFLCISHVLNQLEQSQNLECESLENWMGLFPVAYGKINLQKISKNSLVGCQLKKIQNFNQTLDRQLNQIIVRPNLNCLGSISMQKRKWGYICLQLQEVSMLQLEFSTPNDLIYFTFDIQSSKRRQIASVTTEARNFNAAQKLVFITNKFKFFYMEQKGETESLKIMATLLTFNNSFTLFEKRIDLSEYLRSPGFHSIVTLIKPTETKGVKNLVQIKFKLTNSKKPIEEPCVLQQARRINKIDIVSYENYTQDQLVDKLTMCQQPSHLLQVLNQLKESVMYSKQSQVLLFKTCGFYLQFQNDTKIISTLLEMMNIQILKYPQVVNKLSESQTKKIYEYIKIICQSNPVEVRKLKKMSTSDYNVFLSKIDKNKIDQNIKFQKQKLYTPDESSSSASLVHIPPILVLIQTFVKKSKLFRELFIKDVMSWDEMMSYKEDHIFVKYFHLLNLIFVDAKVPSQIVQDFLSKGLNKNISTQPILEMWSRLPKQKMLEYIPKMFKKLVSKFDNTKEGQESVQSFRSFINHIQMQKLSLPIQIWKEAIQKCGELISNNNDFITLSQYGELLVKLNSVGYIQQNQKVGIVSILKKKQASQHDKNIKLALGNIIDKICGKKLAAQELTTNKTQFYKKYLITS